MSNRWACWALAAAVAAAGLAGPAQAQGRDPAYQAARQQGLVGERMDGYLGTIGNASPDLRALVEDINIKRKAVYAEKARQKNATLEEYALTAGCVQIAGTSPGEKYQAPDGTWQTRGANAPLRDGRCP